MRARTWRGGFSLKLEQKRQFSAILCLRMIRNRNSKSLLFDFIVAICTIYRELDDNALVEIPIAITKLTSLQEL